MQNKCHKYKRGRGVLKCPAALGVLRRRDGGGNECQSSLGQESKRACMREGRRERKRAGKGVAALPPTGGEEREKRNGETAYVTLGTATRMS